MAPEVYLNEEYDTKVDVFSFSLILQEVKRFSLFSMKIPCLFVCRTKQLQPYEVDVLHKDLLVILLFH